MLCFHFIGCVIVVIELHCGYELQYMGCYSDRNERALSAFHLKSSKMAVNYCIGLCILHGKHHIIQNVYCMYIKGLKLNEKGFCSVTSFVLL